MSDNRAPALPPTSPPIRREWTDGDLLLREQGSTEKWISGRPVWLDRWR